MSIWLQMCEAAGLDPQRRLAAREALLADPAALQGTVYRNEEGADEEEDLGDARVLLEGVFQPPADWSAQECAEFYDGDAPEDFFAARVECEAAVDSRGYFTLEEGDYLALTQAGVVSMYFVCDCSEDESGLHCILLRDRQEF